MSNVTVPIFSIGFLLGMITAFCIEEAHAYDAVPPKLECCIKRNGKRVKVQVDPYDKPALLNCRFIKDKVNRDKCIRQYIDPWSSHHRTDIFKVKEI